MIENIMETLVDPSEFELLFPFDPSDIEPDLPMDLDGGYSAPQDEHGLITSTTNFRPVAYGNRLTRSEALLYDVDQTRPYVPDRTQITAAGMPYQVLSGVTHNTQGTPLAFSASANVMLFNQRPQSAFAWPYYKTFDDEPDDIPSSTSYHTTGSTLRSQEASPWRTDSDSPNQMPKPNPNPYFGTGFDMQGINIGSSPISPISVHSSPPVMSQAPGIALLVHRSRNIGTSTRIGDTVDCEKCNKKRIKVISLDTAPLCTRCQGKDATANARPPEWKFNPKVTLQQARDSVIIVQQPLEPVLEDVNAFRNQGYEWVPRFIKAANHPYDGNLAQQTTKDGKSLHKHYTNQQKLLNRKLHFPSSKKIFTNEDVINKRMWLLYDAVFIYHFGGVQVFPSGAEQQGYGENKTLRFLERLELIEQLMRLNKKVVIDVIELRGVLGFAANPEKYADRKSQNHQSNGRKREYIEAGKSVPALAEERDEEGPVDTIVVAGPSQKRKRAAPRKRTN